MNIPRTCLLLVPLLLSLVACGPLSQAAPGQPPAAQEKPAASLAGDWSGTLQAGGTSLRLVLHFVRQADGTLTGSFDSLDQGAQGIPLSRVQAVDGKVHLESAAIAATFDGLLAGDGQTMEGHWQQTLSLPLTLTRTTNAPQIKRPQEPKPPFPYLSREVVFPSARAAVSLVGTLTLPAGTGPFPAAVLIAGSGPHDRDETIAGHKPFLVLADSLTRRGIAVLRYDKRGIGHSTGDYAQATSADFADDAQAAVTYLQTLPEIAPHRIGLIGHSEGGLIAPLVASHSPDVAFVVLLAGIGLTGEQILLRQSALIGKADGATEAEVNANQTLQKSLYAVVKNEPDLALAHKKVHALLVQAVAKLTPKDRAALGSPEAFIQAQEAFVGSPWFRYILTYDPAPALQKTKCPALALNGSKDLQVPPREDLAAIAAALKAGGNTDVTVKELPGLNHLFQTCRTGSPQEYAVLEETFAPAALTVIGDWIAAHTANK